MADKPVGEVVAVDAVLDALSSPTSSDVYEAVAPYSNDAVAAVAAKRALAGAGNGGSQAFLDINSPLDLNNRPGIDHEPLLVDLWLDASDADTITEAAGKVSQWDDKSGEDNHAAQATAESKPTTGAATIGGLNALTFDGTATFMDSPVIAYPQSSTAGDSSDFLTLVVCEPGAVDLDSFNYAIVGADGSGQWLQLDNSASEPQLQGNLAAIDMADPSGPHIAGWQSQGAFAAVDECEFLRWDSLNGIATNGAPAAAAAALRIGAADETGPSRFWLGKIAEVIHIKGRPTDFQVAQLMGYLAAKWGITA